MQGQQNPLYAAIRHFEAGGKPYKPKWDYKLMTWGYGTPYKKGINLSPQNAEKEMRAHVARKQAQILRRFPDLAKPENSSRLMALTDLTYNAGSDWFNAGLGKAVARGDWDDAKNRFTQYVNAGGERLEGLVRRRQWGAQLFDGDAAAPETFGGAATTVKAGEGGEFLSAQGGQDTGYVPPNPNGEADTGYVPPGIFEAPDAPFALANSSPQHDAEIRYADFDGFDGAAFEQALAKIGKNMKPATMDTVKYSSPREQNSMRAVDHRRAQTIKFLKA